MNALHAIVLGIVQGLTEFLPVSSTAHLRIVPALAGWPDPGAAFTAIVQLGTATAVVVFFREDLIRVARAWIPCVLERRMPQTLDERLGWLIVLGTIPVGIFGLIFKGPIENGARDLVLISVALIVLGAVLGAAELLGRRERPLSDIGARDGLIIGLAQACALVPGVSRSGATISAGLFLGFDREAAARYSFLLSIPAVVLSGLFELKGVIDGSTTGSQPPAGALVIATLAAFVVGYASIAFFLRFITRHGVRSFVIYRVVLGSAVLALTAAGAIN